MEGLSCGYIGVKCYYWSLDFAVRIDIKKGCGFLNKPATFFIHVCSSDFVTQFHY